MQNPSLYKPYAIFDCSYYMLILYLSYINQKQKLFALHSSGRIQTRNSVYFHFLHTLNSVRMGTTTESVGFCLFTWFQWSSQEMFKMIIFEAWQNTSLPMKEHELINRKQAIYEESANPASKHNFRALADNAEPLCLMSLKQLFYSKNSLMACYLLHPLKTFSFLPIFSIQKWHTPK